MSKNLVEIRAVVREYINDTDADVDQEITDAINDLANYYSVVKFDESQTTTADQDYLDLPAGAVRILSVEIDGEFIKELQNYEVLEAVDDECSNRWHVANDQIELTDAMSSTGEEIKIMYRGGYTQPETAVDTNVPDRKLELVYVGAAYRYFRSLVTKVMTSRKDYPNTTPKEAMAARDQWKKELDLLKKDIR